MTPAHPVLVRLTHWTTAAATIALIASGVAILLAHPRLYWGEVGSVETAFLIDLPIPFVFGHSGWGRYLHFLAAWVAVASGIVYVVYAATTHHVRDRLLPSLADLEASRVKTALADHLRFRHGSVQPGSYNVLQRLSYAGVVFVLGPLVLLSGLAFSPALTSRVPALVNVFGGQQSARTVHFFAAAGVVIFLVAHLVMVCVTGFRRQIRAMITGAR